MQGVVHEDHMSAVVVVDVVFHPEVAVGAGDQFVVEEGAVVESDDLHTMVPLFRVVCL